jgi:uncharacterized protein YceK
MKKFLLMMSVTVALAGCTTEASRRADCEAKGVSRDTCYLAEQNRQTAILGASEKQALENAQAAYPQHAQDAKNRQRLPNIMMASPSKETVWALSP